MGAANRGSLDVFMKRVCLEMNRQSRFYCSNYPSQSLSCLPLINKRSIPLIISTSYQLFYITLHLSTIKRSIIKRHATWLIGQSGSAAGEEREGESVDSLSIGRSHRGLLWFSHNLYSLSVFSLLPDTLSSRERPSPSLLSHTHCIRTQTARLGSAVRAREVCVWQWIRGFFLEADGCNFLHTAGPMCRKI